MPFLSKGQIDRYGVAFSENPQDIESVNAVQEYRAFRLNCLTTSIRILNNARLPDAVFVSARLKRLDSIYRKLTRSGTNFKLAQLDDIIGLRVVCRSFQETQNLGARLGELPEKYRIIDYTQPGVKDTGYRCVHTIMRFNQKLNEKLTISVRFEIQTRSFYQHRWAVWSEAHGEDVKLGTEEANEKARGRRRELLDLSRQIARWEERNQIVIQHPLAKHAGNHHLTVVWKQKDIPSAFNNFHNDIEGAVNYLSYLETRFPSKRNSALLLVGIANEREAEHVLQETHPLFFTGQVPQPSSWMPGE